eukprot:514929_1
MSEQKHVELYSNLTTIHHLLHAAQYQLRGIIRSCANNNVTQHPTLNITGISTIHSPIDSNQINDTIKKKKKPQHPNDYILISSEDEDQPPQGYTPIHIHKKKKLLQCLKCEKTFYFITDYDKHLINVHNYRPYRCTQCSKTFKRKFNLNNHIRRVHNKERRFECNVCGKKFFGKNDWKKHYNIHTNGGRHKCAFCDRRFVNKSMLIAHTRTHTKEKPFQCTNCCKRFALRSNLLKHLERKRSCTKTDSISSGSLDSDEMSSENANIAKDADQLKHDNASNINNQQNGGAQREGIAWFSCQDCEQSFQFFSDYQAHQIQEHTFAPFKCTECNGTFRRRGNLHRHQRMIHGWGNTDTNGSSLE